MNETIQNYLRKTLFWMRWAMLIFTLFLLILCMVYAYFVYSESRHYLSNKNLYFFFIEGAYLTAGFFLDYTLYKGCKALKTCLETQDEAQLEVVFRKQRHFWMGAVLMILSLVVLVILMIVGEIYFYR